MSPLMMRFVMAHYRSVCVEGFAPLWFLQGALSTCSKLMAGFHAVLPVCRRFATGSAAGSVAATSRLS